MDAYTHAWRDEEIAMKHTREQEMFLQCQECAKLLPFHITFFEGAMVINTTSHKCEAAV